AEQGLLASEWQQGEGRDRRYYQISELGAELLTQLTGEWTHLNNALAPLLHREKMPSANQTEEQD
ncbi:PadR family transcriptional regulator, partial [Arsukibacterium sp.]|uniref:PadR family transcriptional regulator n=1 Tax=Arsukibacterium sp. TaxID=1977258 RepID=UPI00299DF3FD